MIETVRDYEKMKERIMAEVKDVFRPEFINRVDELIVFHALEADDMVKIAALMLQNVAKRLEEQNMSLEYDDEVVNLLATEGYDVNYGARPLGGPSSAWWRTPSARRSSPAASPWAIWCACTSRTGSSRLSAPAASPR